MKQYTEYQLVYCQCTVTSIPGGDHPTVDDSKYNLALLHKKRKETDIARQLFLECEQIYTVVYGPDHRETVDAVRQARLCVR